MQLLCSQIRFPRATAGVILSTWVCAGTWRWVSRTSVKKPAVKRPVDPMKKVRAWDLVNTALGLGLLKNYGYVILYIPVQPPACQALQVDRSE